MKVSFRKRPSWNSILYFKVTDSEREKGHRTMKWHRNHYHRHLVSRNRLTIVSRFWFLQSQSTVDCSPLISQGILHMNRSNILQVRYCPNRGFIMNKHSIVLNRLTLMYNKAHLYLNSRDLFTYLGLHLTLMHCIDEGIILEYIYTR